MADQTDINELFSQGEKSAKEASETSKGPYETVVSFKDRGYLPEMIAGGTATAVGGFAVKNYLKNLSAVKEAIAAEEEAVRKLRIPSTKKSGQPFLKESGFKLHGNKDAKATLPIGKTGVPYTRLSNVTPIGGPEGVGVGVLKGKEAGAALRMTAEQMVKYLRQQSNFGVEATTPRIQVKGYGVGDTARQTVIVTPADVKAGKLPSVKVPSGPLPAPEANIIPRTLGRLRGLLSKVKGGTQLMSGAFGAIPTVTDELMRQKSDYQNPVTGEVYMKDEVTDLGGLNYATADLATIAKFHPDNAENHPEITDEMRAKFFQPNK